MGIATDHFERVARRTKDPAMRVRKVFLASAKYWLDHLDEFDLLFAGPAHHPLVLSQSGLPFGQSATVRRSYRLYFDVVDAFLATLPHRPVDSRLAADTLIATVHGIIAFPRMTPSMPWSSTAAMARCAIDSLIDGWRATVTRDS